MRTNMIALYAVELMAIACLAYSGTSVNFTIEPVSKAIVGRLMVKNLLSRSKVVHLPYVHLKG